LSSLIIGKNGMLGEALYKRIGGVATTSRDFDLRGDPKDLPEAELVYIVAAMSKFRDCELNPDSWAINVDGPIRVAHHFKNSFIVYISSEAAEWGRTAYGIQKAHAELGLLAVCGYERLAIFRPCKIVPSMLNMLCRDLDRIGKERLCGVHRFR